MLATVRSIAVNWHYTQNVSLPQQEAEVRKAVKSESTAAPTKLSGRGREVLNVLSLWAFRENRSRRNVLPQRVLLTHSIEHLVVEPAVEGRVKHA
jgi:hypothetical protein